MHVAPGTMSIVMPWCDRDAIALSLRENQKVFERMQPHVVLVNCGGDGVALKRMIPARLGYPMTIITTHPMEFNKSLASNLGVRFARRRSVLLLDTDILLTERCLRSLATRLSDNTFVTVAQVRDSEAGTRRMLSSVTAIRFCVATTMKGRTVTTELSKLNIKSGSRSGPGLVHLWRQDFIGVGGMNSELTGWGWEDIDLLFRLQCRGLRRRQVGTVLHIPHESLPCALQSQARNQAYCVGNYCLGHLKGSYARDVLLPVRVDQVT